VFTIRAPAPPRGGPAITSAEVFPAYVDGFLPEDEPLLTARNNAADVGGATPVGPVTGAALRFVAAAIGARAVVEIGTGCGTSGIWMLRGMRDGGVLTSVDVEPEHQRLARSAFLAAGFPAGRYRLISGRALEVLPRLADGAYDLVFCDADRQEYPDYLTAALRLLRPGGIVAFDSALWGLSRAPRPDDDGDYPSHGYDLGPEDAGLDPGLGSPGALDDGLGAADPDTAAVAELREQLRTDERVVPLLLPVGQGLLFAVKRPD
jgi:predicted O-methyltransferase YrrM